MTSSYARLAAVLAIPFTLLLSTGRARAHGGEDHREVASSGAAGPGADGRRVAFGQTGAFELLLKYAPPAAGQDASIMVFLSDYATNAPLEGAKIELELSGPTLVKAVAEPTGTAGIHHAVARLSPGTYSVIATVEARGQMDLVEIRDVDFTAAAPIEAATRAHRRVPWPLVAGIGGGALVLVVLGIVMRRRRRRSASRTSAVVTILLLVAAPLVVRGHGGEDHGGPAAAKPSPGTASGGTYLAKESQFLLGIRTAVTVERDVEARIDTVGQIVPRVDGQATIVAPQPGRIVPVGGKLPFLGDVVTRGQKLVVIEQTLGAAESGELKAGAIRARSAAAEARAQRDQRRRDLERLRSLKGVVADKEIQAAELDVKLAEENLARALAEAGLYGGGQLQRITVTAPIDGVIAEAEVSVGEQVAAGAKLFTIIEPSVLWVEAEVFEADLGRVEAVKSASVRVEGYDAAFPATLYRLGQVVNPATRTVKAIFEVPNPDGRLRPGMFAEVAIGAGGKTKQLAVPDAAVIEEGGRRFVFVKAGPEEFVRREIVLGARDGDVWAVKRGLAKGDRAVVQGTYQLRTAR